MPERKLDLEKFRDALESRRAALRALADAHRSDGDPVELDQTRVGRLSRMDAMQGQAMARATGARRKIELKRIETALARIDTGDYGYCVSCDEEIALRRIELDPSSLTCVACAEGPGSAPDGG